MTHFISCHIIDDALNIVSLFFREIAQLHGAPKRIVYNKEVKFLNYF
jgi:hypothetical protein